MTGNDRETWPKQEHVNNNYKKSAKSSFYTEIHDTGQTQIIKSGGQGIKWSLLMHRKERFFTKTKCK